MCKENFKTRPYILSAFETEAVTETLQVKTQAIFKT